MDNDFDKKQKNWTTMLITAQEQKNLVHKLINSRGHVDMKTPKSFRSLKHMGQGIKILKNMETERIQSENGQMLNRLMQIMSRKPKENGLAGFQITQIMQQNPQETINDVSQTQQRDNTIVISESVLNSKNLSQQEQSTEQIPQSIAITKENESGLQDSLLKQKNFVFELSSREPSCEELRISQQMPEQQTNGVQAASKEFIIPERPVFTSRHSNRSNQQSPKRVVSPDGIQPVVQIGFEITPKFEDVGAEIQNDLSLPVEEVDFANEIALVTDKSETINGGQTNQQSQIKAMPVISQFYPAQISLNQTMRRQEFQRINKENNVMMKVLKETKPSVSRTEWQLHAKKQTEIRRNISKFRKSNAYRSQPRSIKIIDNSLINELTSPELTTNQIYSRMQESVLPPLLTKSSAEKLGSAQRNRSINPAEQLQSMRFKQLQSQKCPRKPRNFQNQLLNNEQIRQIASPLSQDAPENKIRMDDENITHDDNKNSFPNPSTFDITKSQIQNTKPVLSFFQKLQRSPLVYSCIRNIPNHVKNHILFNREKKEIETFQAFGKVFKQNQSTYSSKIASTQQSTNRRHQSNISPRFEEIEIKSQVRTKEEKTYSKPTQNQKL